MFLLILGVIYLEFDILVFLRIVPLIQKYLKKNGIGILMVKARSIDVTLKPKEAYEIVCSTLKENGLKIKEKIDLTPYEKDQAAIIISI